MSSQPPSARLGALFELIGTEIGLSEWKLIDQPAIDAFAELTDDDGPIHTDPETADRIAPFGGTIVQGFLLLSHLTSFAKSLELPLDGVAFQLNYGFDRVRIVTPVPVGSRIRGRFRLAGLEDKGELAALATIRARIELEGSNSPAVVADWLAYLQLTEAN